MTRRELFLYASAAAAMRSARAATQTPPLCIFSKHLPDLGYDDLGNVARQMGFDGVDLTVRKGGHVVPERAAEDLPRAVEAIRGHQLAVPMITTEIVDAAEKDARPLPAPASRCCVKLWKTRYWRHTHHRA